VKASFEETVGWVPPDNLAYRMRYDPEGGGVCGPAAIAADLGLTVHDDPMVLNTTGRPEASTATIFL